MILKREYVEDSEIYYVMCPYFNVEKHKEARILIKTVFCNATQFLFRTYWWIWRMTGVNHLWPSNVHAWYTVVIHSNKVLGIVLLNAPRKIRYQKVCKIFRFINFKRAFRLKMEHIRAENCVTLILCSRKKKQSCIVEYCVCFKISKYTKVDINLLWSGMCSFEILYHPLQRKCRSNF